MMELIAAEGAIGGQTGIGIKEVAAVTVTDFGDPVQALELIVLKRDIAQSQIEAADATRVFRQQDAAWSYESIETATVLGVGIDQSGNAGLQLQSGSEVEISGEPSEVIEAAQPAESAGIVEWGIAAETDTETGGEADVVR